MLKIYNTLVRDKQEFVPIVPGKVGMYVCGMTVYDYCHIGHARVLVVFDMVYRWLKASGYDVNYVRNITDIDDKIIKRAAENGESIHDLTARFIAAMHEDADALGVLRPDHEPRATQYVPEMLDMIAKLEINGLAYRAADGDVNFAVRKFPGYGKLSGKSLEDLRAGERVEVTDNKNDPLDFVLWKHAMEQESDEVKWDSKWGKGRPGWHIECSAMGSQQGSRNALRPPVFGPYRVHCGTVWRHRVSHVAIERTALDRPRDYARAAAERVRPEHTSHPPYHRVGE